MNPLEIKNVNFSYTKEPVLQNINMELKKGDFAVLTGENGSGKSTLLRLILGELKPDSGLVKLLGSEGKVPGGKIGYVAQNGTFGNENFPATVEEVVLANLYMQIGRFRFPGAKHKLMVEQVLEKLNMQSHKKAMIGELSGGMQQRVMLARALVTNPDILILDEPTNGIDSKSIKQLYEILEELHQNHKLTILMVTHSSLSELQSITKVYKIIDGNLLKEEVIV
ncbi:MAG: metal ABC transporter ATP-binding protein [Anaerocolumna sp.]